MLYLQAASRKATCSAVSSAPRNRDLSFWSAAPATGIRSQLLQISGDIPTGKHVADIRLRPIPSGRRFAALASIPAAAENVDMAPPGFEYKKVTEQ